MEVLDIVLAILLMIGLYKGVKNGFFIELAAIIALIAGIYGAIHFSYIAGDYLVKSMDWNIRYINLAAFVITFIAIVIVVHLAGKLLTKFADFAMLGILNKIAGGIFGVVKVAVILGAVLVFFHRANTSLQLVNEETLDSSVLYTPIKEIGAFVFSKVLAPQQQ